MLTRATTLSDEAIVDASGQRDDAHHDHGRIGYFAINLPAADFSWNSPTNG